MHVNRGDRNQYDNLKSKSGGILMNKKFRKIIIGTLTLAMVLSMSSVSMAKPKAENKAHTKSTETTATTEVNIAKITCTASGKLNISFGQNVAYTETLNAVITDNSGKEIECGISAKSRRKLTVSVKGLIKGQNYNLTIEGIANYNSDKAATVSKIFTAKGMKTASSVEKVSMTKKNVIILHTKSAAYYKDATVEVKDADGNILSAAIIKKAKGNIKIKVDGLEKGKKYTVTVNGVKTKKENNFSSITKIFIAK
jgi:hypothetical protein